MPVDRGMPTHSPDPLFYDNRISPNGFGMNGLLKLTFSGPSLDIEYCDLDGTPVVREKWATEATGAVRLDSLRTLIDNPDFHSRPELRVIE